MKWIVMLLALMPSLNTFAQGEPEYFRYQILVTDKTSSTVSESSFVAVPNLILALHITDLQKINSMAVVKADWQKPFFSAWANRESEGQYSINFWGGLARIEGMNDQAHALVACHELGHILGGAPKIKIKEFLWSSAEGQSDYYATSQCLKKYFQYLHKMERLPFPSDTSTMAYTLCRTTYSEEVDFNICLNSAAGIEGFARALEHLNGHKEQYGVEFQSTHRVRETLYDGYPESQCRINTLMNGALGQPRPICWFLN